MELETAKKPRSRATKAWAALRRSTRTPEWGRMSHAEYRANLNGLGIFFGAVLGFVMAATETLGPRDFALTLFFTATLVISILYVSSSRRRFLYAGVAAGLITVFPLVLRGILAPGATLPPHLQPTLAVWLGITIIIELLPREKGSGSRLED